MNPVFRLAFYAYVFPPMLATLRLIEVGIIPTIFFEAFWILLFWSISRKWASVVRQGGEARLEKDILLNFVMCAATTIACPFMSWRALTFFWGAMFASYFAYLTVAIYWIHRKRRNDD